MPGITLKDVDAQEFVVAYAAFLKRSGKIQVPKWADSAKTGAFKELSPYDPDWYYIRAASIARRLYLNPGLGIGAFNRIYGGRKNNGSSPSHTALASGSIQRKALQALEKIGVVAKESTGGRRITSTGQQDLDRVASQVALAKRK